MNKVQFLVLCLLAVTIVSDVVNLDEGWYYIISFRSVPENPVICPLSLIS